MPTVLITGASRGLGFELVRQYAADGWEVLACYRTSPGDSDGRSWSAFGRVRPFALDVRDFDAIDRLADTLRGTPIDVLINNAGVFGPNPWSDGNPAQVFGHIDYAMWADVLRVNTMAPLKMTEAFVEHVAASTERKIVALSSTEGSIAMTQGNLYAYKTSKVALNMVMRNLALDLRARGILVAPLCPGWAKTRMGGEHASVEVPASITGVRRMIAELTPERAGLLWRYNGEQVPW